MKTLAISIFLLFLLFKSIAQELPNDIKFTTYTRENGLPEEYINNVQQDSRGFLWIGSNEGLFRFDGKNYKSWYANSNDSNTFNRNSITILGEYKKGFMLFRTPKLWQINIYNQKIERQPTFKHKKDIYALQKIHHAQWFVSDVDSLYITDSALNITKTFQLANYYPPKISVTCYPLDYPYILLLPSGLSNMYLLNYSTKEAKPFTIDVQLNKNAPFAAPKIYDSITKRLYFSAYLDGYYYIDLQIPSVTNYTAKFITTMGDPTTRSVLLLNPQLLIQGGDRALYISNYQKFKAFDNATPTDKPMTTPAVMDIYKDKKDNIWVSTVNGLNRFSFKQPIINYLKKELYFKDKDPFIEIVKGPDGNIYFLTLGKSLYRLNKKSNTVTRLDSSIGYTWSAVANNNTIIATGGVKKIVEYNTITGKTSNPNYLAPFYATADLVTLVFKAKNGDLWYSINAGRGLVHRPNGSNTYKHYFTADNPSPFTHSHLHCATEDSKGNIWFGYGRSHKLLKWVNSLRKFEEYPVNTLISNFKISTGIKNLFIDQSDNLWITLDGMALLQYNINTKAGRYYDMNDGLPTESISGLCEDGKGRLWVSTTKGLSCFLSEKEKFTTFTKSDGLPEDKFPGEGIYYDKEEQLLYIGAETSIAWFNPDSLLQKAIKDQPPVFIDEMLVNGKKYFFENEKNIQLKSNENNIEFTIAVADFFRNEQLVFQYKLKGAGNEWTHLPANRTITFNNLSSGKYEFTVRSKYQGNDVWTETEYPFTFTIKTPWYKKWWFIGLVIGLTGFLIWYMIRQYYLRKLDQQKAITERQKAIQEERNRIAADMHDDLGSGLTKITYLSQMAKTSNANNVDLEKINKTSTELVENMSEIIWAMKEDNNALSDLILYIKKYTLEYCGDNDLSVSIDFADNYTERTVKGENRRNIFLAVKEILHNIVKHAQATKVIVIATYTKDWTIIIKDDGIGIMEAQNPQSVTGNGLKNIRKRIAAVGGTVDMENDNGTKITLHIPI
jgi:signal transduction histidine kinase/streptogramin lyase